MRDPDVDVVWEHRPRDERGSGVVEFLPLMVFSFFMFMCLITLIAWPERFNAANAAAYEAARAVVEAPDPAAAMSLGQQRAEEVVVNHGFDASDLTVSFTPADPHRGDEVVASVTITLPALRFPLLGEWEALRWTKTSHQRVGDFRSFE